MNAFSMSGSYPADMIHRIDITARLQRRMLEIVGTALPLLTRSRADADLVGLAHLRGEMVDAIDAYCRHVEAMRDAGSKGLDAGCIDLRAAYETFRARWAQRENVDHWAEYRLSAVVMMKQIRALVQQAEAPASGGDSPGGGVPASARRK